QKPKLTIAHMSKTPKTSRRKFLGNAMKGAVGAVTLSNIPMIVPASVRGKNAPSNRINVGAIGNGRISRSHDMPNIWKYDHANIIAVCDLDSKRLKEAKAYVDGHYSKKSGKPYNGVKMYDDYQELLNNK